MLEIEALPLSGQDLIDIADSLNMHSVKWMIYEDLHNIKSIDVLFGDKTAIYLLLQIRGDNAPKVGHWVCLMHHKEKNEYYYYDPYGLSIAEDLSLTHEHRHIEDLLRGYNFKVNKHRHQLMKDDVNTCGRHCVLRSVFYHLNGDEYNRHVIEPCIKKRLVHNPDVLVALITGLISKTDIPLIEFFDKNENDMHNK